MLLIASLNRGGLAGACWELDIRLPVRHPSLAQRGDWMAQSSCCASLNDEPASLKTMLAWRSSHHGSERVTPAGSFLEPLPVTKTEKGYTVVKTPEALARITGVASALGDSSRYLWLKLPYCEKLRGGGACDHAAHTAARR